MNTPATLDEVRAIYPPAGDVFPKSVLRGSKSALVMFAAGFYGIQDAYWIAAAGLRATCTDMDAEKLAAMEAVYPAGWEFVNGDAFEYVTGCDKTFDVVTADAPTLLSDRCIDELPWLLSVANRACVISVHAEMSRWQEVADGRVELPKPWKRTGLLFRSRNCGGCYWLILERAS